MAEVSSRALLPLQAHSPTFFRARGLVDLVAKCERDLGASMDVTLGKFHVDLDARLRKHRGA